MTMQDVLRRSGRSDVEFDVALHSPDGSYAGVTKNIGAGGLFVATDRLRRVGERVGLTFTLPGNDAPLSVDSEVRWIRPRAVPERPGRVPGMGVRFVGLSVAALDLIEQFLRERELRARQEAGLSPPPHPPNGRSRK
jgi:uncharacterized protein (TIGR02266 family)